MSKNDGNREVFRSSPLINLLSLTCLCAGIVTETLLMSWELWPIPLLLAGLLVSWWLHIGEVVSARARIWIYALLMMASFFFYGIHTSSTFDMGVLMTIIIMVFTTSGENGLIHICQITYFVTLTYDVIVMSLEGTEWDKLLLSRLFLHFVLLLMAGWLARTIIKRWSLIFGKSGEKIAELNESTNRMNSFMANLSHELRTPINAILGITNVMLDKETDPELKSDMDEILIAGNRLADQVGDILDYSEIEMDSLVVNSDSYMIASVLNDLVSEIRPIMPEELELVIDVDAEIPAILKGDATKIRKIMYHLINNGLKYTKEGGVYVKLSVIKQDYGVNLCITVKDTGIGMSKKELDKIYNRFYQGDSGREVRSGGLGISMVIVSGFVRSLGGFMTVSSETEEGTTVKVSIPQEIVDDGRCMEVAENANITLGAYLDMTKYMNPNVREFYNKMILNIVRGLKTTMHWVDNENNLKNLVDKVELTHLFVADEEYERSSSYLEELASRMQVVVVAKNGFKLPKDSKAQIMQKPFYCIPVVGVLNSDRSMAKQPETRMCCNGVRALVVDDEPMNLSVARGIFRRYGMEVITASSGEEAISMCAEGEYDVVFMDHMMPEMDGVEAMKRIRHNSIAQKKNSIIIALTANALSSAKEMFIEEGFDGFVSKPIELIELERVLKHVLPKSAITYEPIEVKDIDNKDIESKTKVEDDPEDNTVQEEIYLVENRELEDAKSEDDKLENSDLEHDDFGDDEFDDEFEMESSEDDIFRSCGIDKAIGLKYCEQDEELYDSLLDQYVEESKEKRSQLDEYLNAKDMKNYAIIVHALKSTSRMIGAIRLSEHARALELSAKEGNVEYVENHHEDTMAEYMMVIDSIRRVKNISGSEDSEVFEFYPEEEG